MNGSIDTRTAVRAILTKADGLGAVDALSNVVNNSPTAMVATAAIGATIVALNEGVQALAAHTKENQDENTLYIQDYRAGTVSVFLPDDEMQRSQGEHFFANFLHLLQESAGKESALFRYTGIRYTEGVEITVTGSLMTSSKKKGTRYALMSMPALVFAGPYEYAHSGDPLLDIALRGSDLTLRSKLPRSLSTIFDYKGTLTEHNMLNGGLRLNTIRHLDFVRFMVISFANLLTNLQHPSDLDSATNIGLSDEDAIGLCDNVKGLIDTILSTAQTDQKLNYLNMLPCKDVFYDFIRAVKRETEELREGYQSKKLNQLSLVEIVAQEHGILQILNNIWHHFFYLDKPSTEPTQLLSIVRALSNGLDDHLNFWANLNQIYTKDQKHLPIILGLNQPYTTVIDLIGVFTSLPKAQRAEMLTKIKNHAIGAPIYDALSQLNQDFIESLAKEFPNMMDSPGSWFLINLISIDVASHPPVLQEAIAPVNGVLSLHQHFSEINEAQLTESKPLFTWQLLDELTERTQPGSKLTTPTKEKQNRFLNAGTIAALKTFKQAQYVFIEALRSTYDLQALVDANRNYLLKQDIRNLLILVLNTLQESQDKLSQAIQDLIDQVDKHDPIEDRENDPISNQRRRYILELTHPKHSLDKREQLVKNLISSALGILRSPALTKQIGSEIIKDVDDVLNSHDQYRQMKGRVLSALGMPDLQQVHLTFSREKPIESPTQVEETRSDVENHATDSDLHVIEDNNNALADETRATAYPIEWFLPIVRLVSTFLLVVGLLTLLSLTLSGGYLFALPALGATQFKLGLVSTIMGTIGWGASFFQPANAEAPVESSRALRRMFGFPASP